MIRSAPICFAESTPSSPTAPSPTTTTVAPGLTFAASAANQPVPITSERASRLGIMSLWGTSRVATSVPSASGTRMRGAWRADDGLEALTRRLIPVPAVRTGVVGGEERPDHELTGLERRDAASDLLDDAAILVSHRNRGRSRLNAAVRPQVGPADARCGQTDDARPTGRRWLARDDLQTGRRARHIKQLLASLTPQVLTSESPSTQQFDSSRTARYQRFPSENQRNRASWPLSSPYNLQGLLTGSE